MNNFSFYFCDHIVIIPSKNEFISSVVWQRQAKRDISDQSPIVIISFVPPYYPHAANFDYPSLTDSVTSLSNEINSFTCHEWNEKYKKLNYYMQISDMSFASFPDHADAVTSIGSNMPFWDKYYGGVFNEIQHYRCR